MKEKQKKYSGQPTVLLSFFSWVEGVVYVDAPVSLAHLSNLEHVRVSVKSYRCIEWNQTSFSMQTAGKRLCRLVWSTSSSSALLQPPFIIPAQYICVHTRTSLRLILLIIQIFIVTSTKAAIDQHRSYRRLRATSYSTYYSPHGNANRKTGSTGCIINFVIRKFPE